jgi:hypothetical protein
MKNLVKAALIAGGLAISSFAVSSPAAAQASFGFSYSQGYPGYYDRGYYGRPYYGPGYYRPGYGRNCRMVTRVRYDRWGYPRYVRNYICRPGVRAGYGYGYRGGYYGY